MIPQGKDGILLAMRGQAGQRRRREASRVRRGSLIALEGGEGTGKTTHARLLGSWLRRQGHRVVLVREPGGTAVGERIRRLLLDPGHRRMDPRAELLLYEAARAQLVAEVVRPSLARGAIVVADRFVHSSLAYQAGGRGIPARVVAALNRFSTGGRGPDLVILLDLPARAGLRRGRKTPDRLERQGKVFHDRVRAAYLALAARHPRIRMIRTSGEIRAVQAEIRRLVGEYLSRAASRRTERRVR